MLFSHPTLFRNIYCHFPDLENLYVDASLPHVQFIPWKMNYGALDPLTSGEIRCYVQSNQTINCIHIKTNHWIEI